MGFYLKLTDEEASEMISRGINDIFNGIPTKFNNYTFFVENKQTGDKYWRVENLQYNGVIYDVVGWLDANYPSLTRYTHDFVSQFLPEHEV